MNTVKIDCSLIPPLEMKNLCISILDDVKAICDNPEAFKRFEQQRQKRIAKDRS